MEKLNALVKYGYTAGAYDMRIEVFDAHGNQLVFADTGLYDSIDVRIKQFDRTTDSTRTCESLSNEMYSTQA